MNFKGKIIAVIAALTLMFAASGCSGGKGGKCENTNEPDVDIAVPNYDVSDMFTTRDLSDGYAKVYNESENAKITLGGSSISCSDPGVSVAGRVATLTRDGVYEISGNLTDGRIVVDVGKLEKVQIILKNANISCSTSAALYVKQADKVFVTLDNGTTNSLKTTGDFVAVDSNKIDGAVFSKEDISFGGGGALTVSTANGNGIVCKKDLKITNGTLSVTATKHAIEAKNSVRIAGGNVTVNAGTDGVHVENVDKADKGYFFSMGGKLNITSDSNGIDAEVGMQIDGGEFTVKSGSKSIKCSAGIAINDGKFDIDSMNDGISAGGNLKYRKATATIKCADDGVHASGDFAITSGKIEVTESYEGIEANSLYFAGGEVKITSSDDGINAAGGVDNSGNGGMDGGAGSFKAAVARPTVKISGGKITINSRGDGIDANGDVIVSGGETYISASPASDDAPLDYDATATITGGTFIAVGGRGMAKNFGSSSTQGSILYNFSALSSGDVTLKDSAGKLIAKFAPPKQYNSVLVSCPKIAKGKTYTLGACGQTESVTMQSLIYTNA